MAAPAKTPAGLRGAGPTAAATRRRQPRPEQQALALEPPAAAARTTVLPRAPAAPPLWLCLYLPQLPLEALQRTSAAAFDAVFEEQQGLRRILLATPAARAAGIRPGLSVNAALALEPGLRLAARRPQCERQTLRQLAGWAERYTAFVVVEPGALLLEIAASLRLFGGLKALRQRVLRELGQRGFHAQPAIAPTPLAATWLARAGSRRCIVRPDKLTGALAALPVACLDWPASVTESLAGMGIRRIGDCLRLPRAGFARRFGAARLLQLDRALGRLPDPRDHHRAAERFCADCDLDGEQDDRARLLLPCARLLQQLERFLLARQLAVQRLQFVFYHLQAPATPLTLGCVQAEPSAARWLELLQIRFERVALPAPVIALRLCTGTAQPLTASSGRLGFAGSGRPGAAIAQLVERLATRIGARAVHGLDTVAEHRPDRAWRAREWCDDTPRCGAEPHPWYAQRAPQLLADMRYCNRLLLQRPLWVLEAPEALACRDGRPCYGGALALRAGPERIESGWWDAAGIARDYYVARNPAGVHLWVFRNRSSQGGWYLHGIFG